MRSRSGGQGKDKMQQFRFFRGNLSRWNSHGVFGPNNTPRFPAPASVKFETGCSAGVRSLCAHFWGPRKATESGTQHLGPRRAHALFSLRAIRRKSALKVTLRPWWTQAQQSGSPLQVNSIKILHPCVEAPSYILQRTSELL